MSVLEIALPAVVLAFAAPLIKRRIELSRAKHRSLAGHSRMAKRLARWLPGYAYDETGFFRCDGAATTWCSGAGRRSKLLSAGFASRYARSLALTAQAREGLADLQFTGRYRVPFQFSPIVSER
jgi:glutamate-1-semialdehyde 2,1-aminomutase